MLCSSAFAQGTAFTFNGRLTDESVPANGSYDMLFILYTAELGGSQVGPILTNAATPITNGLFMVTLDFGTNFPGADRFLDIAVRTNGTGSFVTVSPRKEILATPYAITASNLTGTVSSSGISGTYSAALTFNNAANTFTGNGAGLTTFDASQLASGTVPNARLSGTYSNAITLDNPANSFAGNGAGLTALNASQLANGIVPGGRLAGSYANALSLANPGNSFSGNGAGLTSLNASSLASGTVPSARLTSSLGLLDVVQTYTADKAFSGGAQVLADIGSASAPGLAFRGQTNTGVFEPGANLNTVAFSINGVERLRLDSSGRMGIGTTTPTAHLTVAGSGGDATIGAATFMLDNTSSSGHSWEWYALNDGSIQLLDTTVGGAAGIRLVIGPDGYVGIGALVPSVPLEVEGGTDAFPGGGGYIVTGVTNGLNVVIDENEIMARNNGQPSPLYLNRFGGSVGGGAVIIGSGSGAMSPESDNSQRVGSSGNRWKEVFSVDPIIQTSDARLKENISDLPYGLETVLALRPVSFQWKKAIDDRTYLGLVAQEVEPIVPEAVVHGDKPEHPSGMNYNDFIPILIKALQERQAFLEAQRGENRELLRRLENLERLIAQRTGSED